MLSALCKTLGHERFLHPLYKFCNTNKNPDDGGTPYSNWLLARSAKQNHDISYLKRRFGRDRYNIHKLTNLDFMCNLVNREDKYSLNLNECIVLLAQMNHVCNVLQKDKAVYEEFRTLTQRIMLGIYDPEDYVCLGTFVNALVDLGEFGETIWIRVIDALFARKYDEEYDELFGLYAGLYKYKQNVEAISDYAELQKDKIIFNIPIIYRNSLETVRQYVRHNTYNLKECRLLFRALHAAKVNEKHFWQTIHNWFALFLKEQLLPKDPQEFFLLAESAIDKVLFDDGIIRPRSVLEEVSEIGYILSEHGFTTIRFLTFVEHLVIYSIERGSELFVRYLEIEKQEEQNIREKGNRLVGLNDHMETGRDSEQQRIEAMQQQYRTVFVNPTDITSEALIQLLTVLRRMLMKPLKEGEQVEQRRGMDGRVLNWLAVRLCQPKMKFTVAQLLQIVKSRSILQPVRVDVRALVLEKVRDVRENNCSLSELKDLLRYLPLLEFESIAYILDNFLQRAHPKEILNLTRLIETESMSPEDYDAMSNPTHGHSQSSPQQHSKQDQTDQKDPETQVDPTQLDRSHLRPKQKNKRWMPYMVNYFLRLPGAVNYHQNYFSFDQNCYFLWLLLKNQEYWQPHTTFEYEGEMEKLKHSIKITAYSRGFKLQMGSYFYQLLNYVDLVSFFDGG